MNQLDGMLIAIIIFAIVLVAIMYDSEKPFRDPKAPSEINRTKSLQATDYQALLHEIEQFLTAISTARNDYFRHSFKEELKNWYKPIYQKIASISNNEFSSNPQVKQFHDIFLNLDTLVPKWNKDYVEKELLENKELFDCIDGKPLDQQQRRAVVVDEDNNLVLAGAGTGKTFTISSKVKYLVDRKNVNTDKILLISFTNKSANEMQERISKKLGIDVNAKTFHKLGLDIVTEGRGKRPDVCEDKELLGAINHFFKYEILENRKTMIYLIEYFGYYMNIPGDIEKYEKLGEIDVDSQNASFETLRSKAEWQIKSLKSSKRTIRGEYVRSLEELMIANFLFIHGVDYEYEREYPYHTGDPTRKTYRPDFYLVESGIYLEHFGINENGRAPWLSFDEERKYLDGIRWKRAIHNRYHTTLLETYSYQNIYGRLLDELDSLLTEAQIDYVDVDLKEIYKKVFLGKTDDYFKEFKKLISTFIKLFKSRGYSEVDFDKLNKIAAGERNQFLRRRTILFLSIVKPIFLTYEDYLKQSRKIDFEDMINQATDLVIRGEVQPNYEYIIVDEYQDISDGRFRLIKAIKQKTNARVMAVGDDWQSIYRFAGSDINLFNNFARELGFTETLKIERTYRNSQDLVDIAGQFVTKNPKQLKKKLVSDKSNIYPIQIVPYKFDPLAAVKYAIDQVSALERIDEGILLLGRTNYDVDVFEPEDDDPLNIPVNNHEFKVIRNRDNVKVKYDLYPQLEMPFLTVHRAKGLEAANVIVLNMSNSLLGFPNLMLNDPVLSLVLTEPDEYEYAEERRLFYVALTRTKNDVYLITPEQHPSVFVEELRKDYDIARGYVSEEGNGHRKICPLCNIGYLKRRRNSKDGSIFWGCSRWPDCRYSINIE